MRRRSFRGWADVGPPCVALLLAAAADPALASPLPEPIRAMVAAAVQTRDPAVVAAVVSVAKQTAPDSVQEIDALASRPPAPPAPAAVGRLPVVAVATEAAPVWKGELEIGGGRSTGSSRTLRLYGAFDLSRATADWTHRLTARADYQETGGAPTTQRVVVAYQPELRLEAPFYAYGLGQYEHDRFLGYRDRFTIGAGMGVSGVDRPTLKVSFDAGPAFRRTDFYEIASDYAIAGRGAIKVKWTPSPRVTISQDVAVYFEADNATARSSTALDTQLFGPLKARLSQNILYERNALFGRKSLDTTSRASLIYRF